MKRVRLWAATFDREGERGWEHRVEYWWHRCEPYENTYPKWERNLRYYAPRVKMATLAELPDGADWWELSGERRRVARHIGDQWVMSWHCRADGTRVGDKPDSLRADFLVLVAPPKKPPFWTRVRCYRLRAWWWSIIEHRRRDWIHIKIGQ